MIALFLIMVVNWAADCIGQNSYADRSDTLLWWISIDQLFAVRDGEKLEDRSRSRWRSRAPLLFTAKRLTAAYRSV